MEEAIFEEICPKHGIGKSYVGLGSSKKQVFYCAICMQAQCETIASRNYLCDKHLAKAFGKNNFMAIDELCAELGELIGQKQKKDAEDIKQLIQQLQQRDREVNLRLVRNLLFEKQFQKNTIQQFKVPTDMNVTSNVIALFNMYLIFGTEIGELHVFSINSNQIILTKQVFIQGIIVLLSDNIDPTIFYGAGYSGEIAKCQIKLGEINGKSQEGFRAQQGQVNEQQKGNIDKQQEDQNELRIEQKSQQLPNQAENNIDIKILSKIQEQTQISRAVLIAGTNFLAVGIDRNIHIWNIKTNKLFRSITRLHNHQVYGLEDLGDGKHILSVCKNAVNLIDLYELECPLISEYNFQGYFLCTRIKKISENEFVVMIFPKGVIFFELQVKEMLVFLAQYPEIKDPKEKEKYYADLKKQEECYQNKKCKNSEKQFPKDPANDDCSRSRDSQIKRNITHKIFQSTSLTIIKTGQLIFNSQFAYNINMFDNYYLNISGDYPYSILVNSHALKDKTIKLNDSTLSNENVSYLPTDSEKVLTSIMLNNICIKGIFYSNVIVNFPRYYQEENMGDHLPSVTINFIA